MMNILTSAAALIVIIIYAIHVSQLKEDRFFKFIRVSAPIIGVTYCLLDVYVMSAISQAVECFGDGLPLVLLGALHACEIFILQTHFFDNGYEDYFFLHEDQYKTGNETLVLIIMVTLAALAVITSASLIIRVIAKRRSDRNWLAVNRVNSGISHIFLAESEQSSSLARDIKRHSEPSLTILVGYPHPDANTVDLSIWGKIKKIIRPESRRNEAYDAVVYTKSSFGEFSGSDLYDGLGLKELKPYFEDENCKLYLLGENEEQNFNIVQVLGNAGCKAEIFCRACREGANRMYEEALTNSPNRKFHIVDASYLAVRAVKNDSNLLPVNFVDIGVDDKGQHEGWVSSEFNSMIIGFGEIGRESLKFLYEHAAFTDKDFKKSPFKCTIIDSLADGPERELANAFPGMSEKQGVHIKQMEAGSNKFWSLLKEEIASLNYIVICTGNDKLNLKLAIDILECGNKSGKDLTNKFAILVAIKKPSQLDDMVIRHYNGVPEYQGCLHVFADERKLWTVDNITNSSLKEKAKKYFIGYEKAQGKSEAEAKISWDIREAAIQQADDYKKFLDSVRKKQQDYANCFHAPTKLALMGNGIVGREHEIAADIPESYTSTHYTGTDQHISKVLKYMAVGEHLRWEASHVAMGYRPGKKRDVLLKIHEYILDYDKLDPNIQHYDYLVVKTTLELM